MENLGTSGNRLGSKCPKGERWICFTFVTGSKVQDLVKEQLASIKAKPVEQSKSVPISLPDLYKKLEHQLEQEIDISRLGKKNLFVELGERISKELNQLLGLWRSFDVRGMAMER